MGQRPKIVSFLTIVLFAISIGYFFYSGAVSVNYLLGNAFGVETGKNFIDFLIGVVAIISSVIIFVGAIFAWNMKSSASTAFIYGAAGFIIKNILEIANEIVGLANLPNVTKNAIWVSSAQIGNNIFHMGFWIFIAIFFSSSMIKSQMD